MKVVEKGKLLRSSALVLTFFFAGCSSLHQIEGEGRELVETFDARSLDLNKWEITRQGDFKKSAVDVYDADPTEEVDRRLRLGANTRETSASTKFLGIRSVERIDFSQRKSISFDLDWNNQLNGSYLAASMYICPTRSNSPREEKDWLKFEYVGVPPGRNARPNIWVRGNGGLPIRLYTDWGPRDSDGRSIGRMIGNQRIKVVLDSTRVQVFENGKELNPLSPHYLTFTSGYLYLQMSSGPNYFWREVYFDNIEVTKESSFSAGLMSESGNSRY